MNVSYFGDLPASACVQGTGGSYGADRITERTYDGVGRLLKLTRAVGSNPTVLATYTYTPDGKVGSVKDGKGNLTTYIYDGFDRLSKTEYPSPTTAGSSNASDYEQLGYDANGNITSRRLRDGTTLTYVYDVLDRPTSKAFSNGESTATYAYDLLGEPTTIHQGTINLTYAFDALGRMTSAGQAFGSLAYQYDLDGERTRLTWQDGMYVSYDYDATGAMTDIKENGSTVLASFAYDDLGRRTSRTLANGTSTTYGYDAVSRLTSLALAGGTNTNTVTLSNYDPAGEIGSRANSNDAFAWTQGVNVNRSYTTNGLNQYSAIAAVTQGYDARGNLTSSGGVTYAYTAENLLKSVSGGTTLYYDPLGRLDEYDTTVTTRFVYDGGMIAEEVNSAGTILRRTVFGPAGDEPIVWYEGSGTGTKRYMDQDERGSVTRITNQDGSTYAIDAYDEYGIPASTNQGRFQYTGQAWLPEIGLYDYKARMYSPTLGRFMQTDPIGYGDGPNWYNYAHSNPVNGIDPSGTDFTLDPEECVYCNAISWFDGSEIVVQADQMPDQRPFIESSSSSGGAFPAGAFDSGSLAEGAFGDFGGDGALSYLASHTPLMYATRGPAPAPLDTVGNVGISASPQKPQPSSTKSCLRNIDADTLAGLGLDTVGLVASATGLKAAWTAGSAAVGATTALLAVTASALTGGNREQAVALGGAVVATGAPLIPEGASAASKAIAESLPGVGIAVSGGVLAYDSYNALKKAGCF